MPYNVYLSDYKTPKWQAPVTPINNAFQFYNGFNARNLWELKQGIRVIPEDVLSHHVNTDKHDVAAWIEDCVGDVDLANQLKYKLDRWQILSNLEKHQMQQVNLPSYLAKRWLNNVNVPFYFQNGFEVHSLEELLYYLERGDEANRNHLDRSPNDFSVWIDNSVGDYELAQRINILHNIDEIIPLLSDRITMLKHQLYYL